MVHTMPIPVTSPHQPAPISGYILAGIPLPLDQAARPDSQMAQLRARTPQAAQ